jgi:hypothetical protein
VQGLASLQSALFTHPVGALYVTDNTGRWLAVVCSAEYTSAPSFVLGRKTQPKLRAGLLDQLWRLAVTSIPA